MNVIGLVTRYRDAAKHLRGIAYRQALGLNGNRNSAGTERAEQWWNDAQSKVITELLGLDQRQIVGLLTAEASLAFRMQQARRLGQARPELAWRLRDVRRELRKLQSH